MVIILDDCNILDNCMDIKLSVSCSQSDIADRFLSR